jgi:carbamoyltransferase
VCEQERATRVRASGFNATGLPDEALDLLLGRAGRTRQEISRYAIAEDSSAIADQEVVRVDHHRAHACAAYYTSGFDSSIVVICDDELPKVSVWQGTGRDLIPIDLPWEGDGFSDLYTACAGLLGFDSAGGEQRFEALARLHPEHRDDRLEGLLNVEASSLRLAPRWSRRVEEWCRENGALSVEARARCAAALQRRVGELLLAFLATVREITRGRHLCLGGRLFDHSSINSLVRCAGLFSRVFVPVSPGNAGLAVGTALAGGRSPAPLSAFLGPDYAPDEIKAALDNCKLCYNWVSESEAIETAVDALRRGQLVAWYEGAMEWGPRALGARSIVANPFRPFVLENLNRFLKRRESWRGYALSALPSAVHEHFTGPDHAPFMECDFQPRDPSRFRHVLPTPSAALRVQSADAGAPKRFRGLLEAFGAVSGVSCLVNTSFNGVHEPIVCSPHDAIRVFYGSGVDLLLLDRFVLTK